MLHGSRFYHGFPIKGKKSNNQCHPWNQMEKLLHIQVVSKGAIVAINLKNTKVQYYFQRLNKASF